MRYFGLLFLLIATTPAFAQSDCTAIETKRVCGSVTDTHEGVCSRFNGIKNGTTESCGNAGKKGEYGYQWQCVEYVRRFYKLAKNHPTEQWDGKGNANQFFTKAAELGLVAFKNGETTSPPRRDDILGFENANHRGVGHVAIIKEILPVSLGNYRVRLIEQNFSQNIDVELPVERRSDGTYFMPDRGRYRVQGWMRLPDANWILASPSAHPSARTSHAMVFDDARQQVVLFGGSASGALQNDTWLWDGSAWHQAFPSSNPSPRALFGMAYDAVNQQVVLFGGFSSGGTFLRDTWMWDGSNWTQKFPANRPALAHEMSFDSERRQIMLLEASSASRTWVWDGNNWTLRTPTSSPPTQGNAAITYDAARQKVVEFSGFFGIGNASGDTWTWDGADWTHLFPHFQPPLWRGGHELVFFAARNQVVLFGGATQAPFPSNLLGDTWIWDGSNWWQTHPSTSPSPRQAFAMAYDSTRKQIVLFGGSDAGGARDDTWILP